MLSGDCVRVIEKSGPVMRSLAICLVMGHWSRICISVPVACWLQYGHNLWYPLKFFSSELMGWN